MALFQRDRKPQGGSDRLRTAIGKSQQRAPVQGRQDEIRQSGAEREELLAKQFGAQRGRLKRQEAEAGGQLEKGLGRLQARVGAVGGSVEKARQAGLQELGETFGQAGTELAAQEAGALQALKGETEARLGQESQFERQAQQQADQFAQTMEFQRDSFADQMSFQWAEFDENLKTNFLNAAMAMKESGLQSGQDWVKLATGLQGLFGDRFDADRFFTAADREKEEAERRALAETQERTRRGGVFRGA